MIERPNADVRSEQIREACRTGIGKDNPHCRSVKETAPLNPATYEWMKRVDRDIGLWGDPD